MIKKTFIFLIKMANELSYELKVLDGLKDYAEMENGFCLLKVAAKKLERRKDI